MDSLEAFRYSTGAAILRLNNDGKIVESLDGPGGIHGEISQVTEIRGALLIGTVRAPYIGRLKRK